MVRDEHNCIEIPKSLYARIEKICEDVECKNVNDLIVKMLREKISEFEDELYAVGVSEEERREIVERLKKLGYL